MKIFNDQHQVIPGGDTINFGPLWNPDNEEYISNKNLFAIPNPAEDSTYILIHFRLNYSALASGLLNDQIAYSIIDTRAIHGLGRVTSADVVLTSGNFTHGTVIKHGNGRDWWLIAPERNSRNVWRYLIGKDGISGPYLQVTTFQFPDDEFISPIVATPNGQTIIRSVQNQGFILYHFDRCTGLVSNTRVIHHPHTTYIYDLSVSQDDRFLYFSDPYRLCVMDLKAEFLIPQSIDTIAEFDGFLHPPVYSTLFYQHTLGPDNKIYFSTGNSTKFLHVLHAPQLPGQACDFEQRGLNLFGNWHTRSMPAYINYRLGALGNACPTLKPDDIPTYYEDSSGFQLLNAQEEIKATKSTYEISPQSFFNYLPNGSVYEKQ